MNQQQQQHQTSQDSYSYPYYNYYNYYQPYSDYSCNSFSYADSFSSNSYSQSPNTSYSNSSSNYSGSFYQSTNDYSHETSPVSQSISYDCPLFSCSSPSAQANSSIQIENKNQEEKPQQTKRPRRTVALKNQLPDLAVDIMNEWFDDHLNSPYPSLEEKERMASRGGITIKQVNAWFSNRRNRSQNTKPKRIKREFEKEIASLVNELSATNECQQPNKDTIIAKLQKTLQSASGWNSSNDQIFNCLTDYSNTGNFNY